MFDWFERLDHKVDRILEAVYYILRLLALRHIDFIQVGGCEMSTNFSIVAGTSGSFSAVLTPTNGAQAPGTFPKWTSSDAAISLSPSADGLTCQASVPLGHTAATFELDITAVSSDSSVGTLTNKHTITIVQPAPPPLSAIDFVQTS